MYSKKLVFLSSFEYPTKHAHPKHGLEMATAFSSIFGERFLFVYAAQRKAVIPSSVQTKSVLGGMTFIARKLHIRALIYAFWVPAFFARNAQWRGSIVFVNDVWLAAIACMLRNIFDLSVVFESHGMYYPRIQYFIFKRARRVIFTTKGLQAWGIKNCEFVCKKSKVLSNAVDISLFDSVSEPKEEIRSQLKLPLNKKIISYIGRFKPLGIDKGIGFMIDALAQLPDEYEAMFVGGTGNEISAAQTYAASKNLTHRVRFVPFVESLQIPLWCKASDVLCYVPTNAASSFQSIETSPMKLFEYMASRRPIVVSRSPGLIEALGGEDMAEVITPGSLDEFVRAVKKTTDFQEDVQKKVDLAYTRVVGNTWDARAKNVLKDL